MKSIEEYLVAHALILRNLISSHPFWNGVISREEQLAKLDQHIEELTSAAGTYFAGPDLTKKDGDNV